MYEVPVKYEKYSKLESFTLQAREYQQGYSSEVDIEIDYDSFVTEDDTHVGNLFLKGNNDC